MILRVELFVSWGADKICAGRTEVPRIVFVGCCDGISHDFSSIFTSDAHRTVSVFESKCVLFGAFGLVRLIAFLLFLLCCVDHSCHTCKSVGFCYVLSRAEELGYEVLTGLDLPMIPMILGLVEQNIDI